MPPAFFVIGVCGMALGVVGWALMVLDRSERSYKIGTVLALAGILLMLLSMVDMCMMIRKLD